MTIAATKRCILRLFTRKDAEDLLPILGDTKVMQYSITGAMDLPAIVATIDEWLLLYRKHGFCPFAVIYDGQVIGYAGLDVRDVEGVEQVQITFRLAEKYWGKGLATELASTIKTYAFDKCGLSEIVAIIDPDNSASINTVTKIGMKFSKKILYGGLRLNLYKIKKADTTFNDKR